MAEHASKVIIKSTNIDLYKDNYVSFRTAYPITSAEGIAVFITNTDMFDSDLFTDSYMPFVTGYGLGLLPNFRNITQTDTLCAAVDNLGGSTLWTFPTPDAGTQLNGLSADETFMPVKWGDGTLSSGSGSVNKTFDNYSGKPVSGFNYFFNHIASVALDGRGGYGLSGFAFTDGGNDYISRYSITNRVLSDMLSTNDSRGSFSVASHCNTTERVAVLSTGYGTNGIGVELDSAQNQIHETSGLTYRIKFSAFLLDMRVDVLTSNNEFQNEFKTIADLSGADFRTEEKRNEFISKIPRYGRIGIAYAGNSTSYDGDYSSGKKASQGIQDITLNLG